MGDLSEDVCRCLKGAQCDAEMAARAACACEEGRLREAKRVLLCQRQELLDAVHRKQRSIDEIDHMLHRMSGDAVSGTSAGASAKAGNVAGARTGARTGDSAEAGARTSSGIAAGASNSAGKGPSIGNAAGAKVATKQGR